MKEMFEQHWFWMQSVKTLNLLMRTANFTLLGLIVLFCTMTAYSAGEMCISLILYTKLAIAKDLYFICSSSVLTFDDIYSCVVR